ncbi:MAG: alginate export family protein, partial [Phycisphaerae bacterium]
MRVPTLLAYVTLMTLTIHVARADEPPPANASGSPSDEAPADTPVDHSQERSERQSNRDTASETEKPLRGPKYLNLRYDEDFSYLDGEEGTYEPDFWDPIKNIHLDEDWRLSIGGEFAFRLEAMTNTAFDERDRTQDTYGLFRYFLHADLKYKDIFRVFVQAIVAHDEEHQFGRRAFDENIGDLHQLFVDVRPFGEGSPLLVRLGRQELQYGDQRFIAPLDWANTRRRFDAAKLILEGEDWQFDFFYAKPIPVRPVEFDRYDEEFDLYGAYFSYKGIPRHTLDLFLFAVDDTRNRTNPNGNSGDVTRITVGSRLFGRTAGFDYTGVISGQWGNWAGDTIQAWAATLDGGYTFEEHAWKPRIGAGF